MSNGFSYEYKNKCKIVYIILCIITMHYTMHTMHYKKLYDNTKNERIVFLINIKINAKYKI